MHRHRMVAQILLILSILNSALAVPAVSAREIQEARRTVAVRVPGKGVVAMLQKRPYPEETATSTNDASGTSSGHLEPQSANPTPSPPPEEHHDAPQLGEAHHDASAPQMDVYHDSSSSELEPLPAEEYHAPSSVLASPSPSSVSRPPPPPKTNQWEDLWRKTMTRDKIKATKQVALVGLATVAYLGLLLPEITQNDNQNQDSQPQDSQS